MIIIGGLRGDNLVLQINKLALLWLTDYRTRNKVRK